MSTVAERSMGLGLKAMRQLATSDVIDRVGLRGPAERALYVVTKNGMGAAAGAGRTFAAVQGRGSAGRPKTASAKGLFDLTPDEDQQMIVEAMQEFAAAELRPAALKADDDCAAPPALLASTSELGLATLGVPEELGGSAAEKSAVTGVLVAEALAHGDLGLAVAALAPGAVANALALWGDPDQQATYLPAFTGDDVAVAALAIAEPRPLFDPFALQSTARKGADGGYVLSGVKALVPRAAEADLLLVAAELQDRGPALFLVETASAGAGLTTIAEPAMGARAAATATVTFHDVALPASALLGDADQDVYAECVHRARLGWCAVSVGAAQAALDYLIPYVNERVAFGEPIANRQAVAFQISDIAIEVAGMRLATWRAASRADAGKAFFREAAVARQLCVTHGAQIGSAAVQLLGGHGYTKEYPVERWYRDLRTAGVLEGALLV
ncbi:MAG: acyl-CoA dehydrogenase domain protein [Solirubrobacterales bacterium]|nr:acyl-CoA dehydrogenase domain protein [Solirubrobacterales bacterium]